MIQPPSLPIKSNPLMNFFLKREPAHPLPDKKPIKKLKSNDEKLTDPLYQILSWRDDIEFPPTPSPNSAKTFHVRTLTLQNPQTWGCNLQGIFINVDWNATSMQSFRNLTLSNTLLSNGMVFIWGGKSNIGQLMDYFEQMGYVYAENFTFVMLSRPKIPQKSQKQLAGNKSLLHFLSKPKSQQSTISPLKKIIPRVQCDYQTGKVVDPSQIFLNSSSQHFCQTQKVLYMFRKINKKQCLELRHQRTSDVFFTIGENMGLDRKAKEVVYRMIETLLINANYKEKENLKLMEMWGEEGEEGLRKGWITVSEQGQG